ncbi:MAG: alcohol dehydrogenase catalytic domain-containing protein [Chloroflexi bacterium]|nr:alcohol dehydrogenase catalytic domain-containing protein [Chloroflexota bacterium]
MKAAILKEKGRFVIEDVPVPRPGPGEVALKVSYCAICGSDVNRFATGRGAGSILGHEFCGRIAEVGEGVEGWSVGDLVAVDPITQCNTCFWCLHEQGNLCLNRSGTGIAGNPGGYAEYAKAKSVQLFHVPDSVSEKETTMAQCLAVALHVFNLSETKIGDNVVVVGAGPIGLQVLACARLGGAGNVYVTEKAAGRKGAAAEMGADAVLDPTEVNIRQRVYELTGIGADVAFGCAGASQAIQDTFAAVRPGGTVALVAENWAAQLTSHDMVDGEVKVRGSRAYWRRDFGEAVDLIATRRVNCEAMITDVEPLANIEKAFEGLLNPTTQVKTLIAP